MKQPLFRAEVTVAQRAEWLAPIRLAMPLPYRFVAIASVLVLLVLSASLLLGHHTRREPVAGQLVPRHGLLAVNATLPGTVTRVFVHENAAVAADEPLLEIGTDIDSPVVGNTRAVIATELREKGERLQAELALKERLAAAFANEIGARIKIVGEQLRQLDAQLSIQSKQVAGSQRLLERIRPLEEHGYISGLQIQQQESNALSAQAELLALQRQKSDKQEQLAILEGQLQDAPLNAQSQLSELRRALAENQAALAQNEGQRALVLRAAQAGVITNLVVSAGQAVLAGQRVISILPEGSDLQAQLWLPSRAAGSAVAGAHVAMRYRAFPYERFGLQYGSIVEVSRSVVSPAEFAELSGMKTDEPQFRVMVELERQDIPAGGGTHALKPGMLFDADILLERESLLEWLVGPLHRGAGSAGAHRA